MSDAYYCKECTIQEKDVRISLTVRIAHEFPLQIEHSKMTLSERRLSQDSQLGKLEDGSFLREEEIWLQKKIITFLSYRIFPK